MVASRIDREEASVIRAMGYSWKTLCSFAHNGIEQIWRRTKVPGRLRPDYDSLDIINPARQAMTAVQVFAKQILLSEAREEEAKQLDEVFWTLFCEHVLHDFSPAAD
jgi:hypothetical protein